MDKKIKILIADENSEVRKDYIEVLRKCGFDDFEEASDGEEALSLINSWHPDIVISEIWLSKLDGLDLMKRCVTLDLSPDTLPSFVIISQVMMKSIFVEAENAGAALCLKKPVDLSSLGEHINTIITNRDKGVI